jgi:hypothetical protein
LQLDSRLRRILWGTIIITSALEIVAGSSCRNSARAGSGNAFRSAVGAIVEGLGGLFNHDVD